MGSATGEGLADRRVSSVICQRMALLFFALVTCALFTNTSARYCVDCQTFLGCLLTCPSGSSGVQERPYPTVSPRRQARISERRGSSSYSSGPSSYPQWRSFDSLVSRARQSRLRGGWPTKF